MNFQSEGDVHVFIEEHFASLANENDPIPNLFASSVEDDNLELTQKIARKTWTAKNMAGRGVFGEIIAKSNADRENVPNSHKNYHRLEDIFPHDSTMESFTVKYIENPLLCDFEPDEPEAQPNRDSRRQKLRSIAGSFSFGSLVGTAPNRDKDTKTPEDLLNSERDGDKLPTPIMKRQSSSTSTAAKKVSWDDNSFNTGEHSEDSAPPSRRLSFSGIMQILKTNRNSLVRKTEIIRDSGFGLQYAKPRGFRRTSSADASIRKSSKSTVDSESSRVSLKAKLNKFFTN